MKSLDLRFGSKPGPATPALPAPARRHPVARGLLSLGLATVVAATSVLGSVVPAGAQRNILPIRDAEIENLIRDYARPIFGVAGLGTAEIGIVIVEDRSFNAFVADSRRIFVNVGAILDTDTPNQLIGVLAHETAHLAGGHLFRLREALSRAQIMAAIATLLGAGAIAAGVSTGGSTGSQIAQGGQALIAGGQSAAVRGLLAYARGEEVAADRGALNYLEATRQSAKGMAEVFRKFADQSMFTARYADPYAQTHPMPADRIAHVESVAEKSRYYDRRDGADLQLRHDLAKAKLYGFLDHPGSIARRYPSSDTSLPARYARAISAYRNRDLKSALSQIDVLLKAQPNNAYFHELKGQALFENGKVKESIAPYRRAVELAPDDGMIRVLYGMALTESNDDGLLGTAIEQLNRGLRTDEEFPIGYRYLAQAYARKGDTARAELASAQQYFAEGNLSAAQDMAKRARAKLKRGDPAWLRADDIVSYKPPKM